MRRIIAQDTVDSQLSSSLTPIPRRIRYPSLSVIVPTFNRDRFLARALDSIQTQTYPGRMDVIVIDDGSTDSTQDVLRPYLVDDDPRTRVRYERLNHVGVVAARNHGLQLANADWIAFLDSDDEWLPGKIANQILVGELGGYGVVHTGFRYVDPIGQFTDQGPQRVDNKVRGKCLRTLLEEDTVIFSSVVMRRSVMQQITHESPNKLAFDPRWTNAQDYDLLLRAARICEFGYVPEPLTHYRVHDSQTGMGNLPRVFEYHCRVQMDFVARYGSELGWNVDEGIQAARNFLFQRAESHYWKREFSTAQALCELAEKLGLKDRRFGRLQRRLARPAILYQLKDTLDRFFDPSPKR